MGTLFIVATPIGNLSDISSRALQTLRDVDVIACEDTRQTVKLLNHFGIQKHTTSYHEFNEERKAVELADKLAGTARIALVSDAGTPAIADPGYRLVRLCRQRGIPVVPIPGPNAAIAALAASGLPSAEFMFLGFLPSKKNARREQNCHYPDFPRDWLTVHLASRAWLQTHASRCYSANERERMSHTVAEGLSQIGLTSPWTPRLGPGFRRVSAGVGALVTCVKLDSPYWTAHIPARGATGIRQGPWLLTNVLSS